MIENSIVEVDHTPDDHTYLSQRGIRLRDGEAHVRNCHVRIGVDDGDGPGGGYAIGALSGTERALIENTSIELTEPGNAFYFFPGFDVSLSNVRIRTTGWNGSRGTVMLGSPPDMSEVYLNGERIS